MKVALVVLLAVAAPARGSLLDQGAQALTDFRAEDAVTLLEQARNAGPYSRADHIRLYEQLGIAYAYLDKNKEALRAFDMLLALDPGRAISYTLSPKVTFLFEQARSVLADRVPATIDLRWPLGLTVTDPVPIDLEVIADPQKFLQRGKLYWRLRGSPLFEVIEVDLPEVDAVKRIELPPSAAASTKDEVLEVYLVAFDDRGNEVYQWGSVTHPREIVVEYQPPDPWYAKWWVWAIAGTVAAAGAGVAVFAVTREAPAAIDGRFTVVP